MLFFARNSVRAVFTVLRRRLSRRGTGASFRQEVLLEFLRALMSLGLRAEPREVRRIEKPMPLIPALRRRVHLAEVEIAGVPGLEIVPKNDPVRGTLLYLHGGGYNFCSSETHRALVARLAAKGTLRAIAPDYRLAPEHFFPAAVDDAVAVFRTLLAEGADPAELWIAGDSAGGGLSLATMLRLRDEGAPLPRGAVLISPWVDLTCRQASVNDNAATDYLNRDILRHYAANYLGGADPENPLASPLYADLAGLPPLLVQVGGAETLRDEGRELAERARTAGVTVSYQEWPEAIHAFPVMGPLVPQTDEAIREAVRFIDSTRA